jgi:hypothetical protein
VPPPYAVIQEFDPGAGGLLRGSVLVLDVQVPIDAAQAEIEAVVRELRRRHSVALALRVPEFRGAGPAWTVAWGYRLGIRAFVSAGEPVAESLRFWLAHPLDLAGDWIQWLRLRRPVSREAAWYIARIVEGAWPFTLLTRGLSVRPGLGVFFEHIGVSERTARHNLARDALPGPERWFDGARLLQAQLALQRDATLTPAAVARLLRYSESLGLSNRLCRVFGATLPTARKLLGLEWRFERWWTWAAARRQTTA